MTTTDPSGKYEVEFVDPREHEPPANAIDVVAYRMAATLPGHEREERTIWLNKLGPMDDIAVAEQVTASLSARQLVHHRGDLGFVGIWWLAGKHQTPMARETFRSLAAKLTTEVLSAESVDLSVEVGFRIGTDDELAEALAREAEVEANPS